MNSNVQYCRLLILNCESIQVGFSTGILLIPAPGDIPKVYIWGLTHFSQGH